jgi:hypothetical protein
VKNILIITLISAKYYNKNKLRRDKSLVLPDNKIKTNKKNLNINFKKVMFL